MAAAQPSAVFVRNLAFDATDTALERHFEAIGPVKEAWIVLDRKTKQSRGFGFVGFVLSDDAQRAVAELNGSQLGGRKITVDLAKKKGEPRDERPPSHKSASTAAAKQKRPAEGPSAGNTGSVASPVVRESAAQKRSKPVQAAGQRHRVIFRNLPFKCNADTLLTAVKPHAEVLDVHFPSRPDGKAPGFAFVEVPSAEACKVVVSKLNETKINGRTVAVDVAMHKAGYEKVAGAPASAGDRPGKVAAQPKSIEPTMPPKGVPRGSSRAKVASEEKDSGDEKKPGEEGEASESASDEEDCSGSPSGVEDNEDGTREESRQGHRGGKDSVQLDEEADGAENEEESADEGDGASGSESTGAAESDSEAEGEGTSEEDEESEADALRSTVFVQGLPIEATEAQLASRFKLFGPLRYVRIVSDPATGISRGTAFVRFEAPESATSAVRAAATNGNVRLLGHPLTLSSAVDRSEAARVSTQKRETAKEQRGKGDGSGRNLHLARYGLILPGEEGSENFSASDLRKREAAWAQKKEKLASPNFSVSATRLSVRNLPLHIEEKTLSAIAVEAARSAPSKVQKRQAAKRKGERLVKQVKIVRDEQRRDRRGEPRSRGFGFIEFASHEFALAALEHLADNPNALSEHGGKGRMLLVEFAVDSVHKLRLHEQRRMYGAQKRAREAKEGSERGGTEPSVEQRPASRPAKLGPTQGAKMEPANKCQAMDSSPTKSASEGGSLPKDPKTTNPSKKARTVAGRAATKQKGDATAPNSQASTRSRPTAKPMRRERIEDDMALDKMLQGSKRGSGDVIPVVDQRKRRRGSAEAKEEARFEQLVGSYKKMLGVDSGPKAGSNFADKLGEWTG